MWQQTHRALPGGARTWTAPDPQAPPAAPLAPSQPVTWLAYGPPGWSYVRTETGWETWIASTALIPIAAPAPKPKRARSAILISVFVLAIVVGLRAFQFVRGAVSPETARWVAAAGLAFSIVMYLLGLRGVRRPGRARPWLDVLRGAIGVFAALGLGYLTGKGAPAGFVVIAVVVGLIVGLGEGGLMRVVVGSDGKRYSRRAILPLLATFVGLVIGVLGAIGSAGDYVMVGQVVAMVGVGLGFGVPFARKLRNRRGGTDARPPTGPLPVAPAAVLLVVLLGAALAPLAALVVGVTTAPASSATSSQVPTDFDGSYDGAIDLTEVAGPGVIVDRNIAHLDLGQGVLTGSFELAQQDAPGAASATCYLLVSDLNGTETTPEVLSDGRIRFTGSVPVLFTSAPAGPTCYAREGFNANTSEIVATVGPDGFEVQIGEDGDDLSNVVLTRTGDPGAVSTTVPGGAGGTGTTGSSGSSTGSTPLVEFGTTPGPGGPVAPEDAAAAAVVTLIALAGAGIISITEAGAAAADIANGKVPDDVLATFEGREGYAAVAGPYPPAPMPALPDQWPPPPPAPDQGWSTDETTTGWGTDETAAGGGPDETAAGWGTDETAAGWGTDETASGWPAEELAGAATAAAAADDDPLAGEVDVLDQWPADDAVDGPFSAPELLDPLAGEEDVLASWPDGVGSDAWFDDGTTDPLAGEADVLDGWSADGDGGPAAPADGADDAAPGSTPPPITDGDIAALIGTGGGMAGEEDLFGGAWPIRSKDQMPPDGRPNPPRDIGEDEVDAALAAGDAAVAAGAPPITAEWILEQDAAAAEAAEWAKTPLGPPVEGEGPVDTADGSDGGRNPAEGIRAGDEAADLAGVGGQEGGDELFHPLDVLDPGDDPLVRTGDDIVDSAMGSGGATSHTIFAGGDVDPNGQPPTAVVTRDDGTVVSTYDDGTVTEVAPDGTLVATSADGSSTRFQPDGTKVTTEADGTVQRTDPDGTVDTVGPDGSRRREDPDGTTREWKPGGPVVVTDPDGNRSTVTTVGVPTSGPMEPTSVVVADDGTVRTTFPNGDRQTKLPDGTIVNELPDGTLQTILPGGDRQVQAPDGTLTVTHADGSQSETPGPPAPGRHDRPDGTRVDVNQDGTVVSIFPDGERQTQLVDGTTLNELPDGTVRSVSPDGVEQLQAPDGTLTVTHADGTETVTQGPPAPGRHDRPEGTTVAVEDDGTIVTDFPDGERQLQRPDGTTVNEEPDGTVTSVFPDGEQQAQLADGTIVTEEPDGTIRSVFPDGAKQVQRPDGTTITTEADGTVRTTEPVGGGSGWVELGPDGKPVGGGKDWTELPPDGAGTGPVGGGRDWTELPPDAGTDDPASTTEAGAGAGTKGPDLGARGVEGSTPSNLHVGPDDATHDVVAGEVAKGGDGRVLTDAHGETLPVDQAGNVRYGEQWVSPQEAERLSAMDQDWAQGRTRGQELVDEYKDTRDMIRNTPEGPERDHLEGRSQELTAQINSDMDAKSIMKHDEAGTPYAKDFAAQVQETGEIVRSDAADQLAAAGFTRGGEPIDASDLGQIRNAKSAGSVGMDDDVPWDQMKERELRTKLAGLDPQSQEATDVRKAMIAQHQANQLTVDYDQLAQHTEGQIKATEADLAAATPGSPEAERLRARHDQLSDRMGTINVEATEARSRYVDDLRRQLEAAPEGSPQRAELEAKLADTDRYLGGRPQTPISHATMAPHLQDALGDSYQAATGQSAESAGVLGTHEGSPDAYKDLAAIKNDPIAHPLAPGWADQTGSVTSHKAADIQHQVELGNLTEAQGRQEIARGTAKDLGGKLLPLLETDGDADPAKIDQLERIHAVLDEAGRGKIPAGEIDGRLQAAVPERPGITLETAVTQVDSNLAAGVKWRDPAAVVPGGRGGFQEPVLTFEPKAGEGYHGALGAVSSAEDMTHLTQDAINRGMDPVEAVAKAGVQTYAGNAAGATGMVNPINAMVAGALLPNGTANVLPDQAVSNVVGTTWEGSHALVDTMHDSYVKGAMDTTKLDAFNDAVVKRPGFDPYKGYAEASQLLGEESVRTHGSIAGDLGTIAQTGAGTEIAVEGMTRYEQEVAAGPPGIAKGWDHILGGAAETWEGGSTSPDGFATDVSNIVTHGVGDGYWEEAITNVDSTMKEVPLLGTVTTGYGHLSQGLLVQGPADFGTEMAEGAAGLRDESVVAVANSMSNGVRWAKSWF